MSGTVIGCQKHGYKVLEHKRKQFTHPRRGKHSKTEPSYCHC